LPGVADAWGRVEDGGGDCWARLTIGKPAKHAAVMITKTILGASILHNLH
jgi:hypothetical protein